MSLNLSDFDDVMLGAMAAVEDWKYGFEAEFIAPLADEMAMQLLASLTPEQAGMMRQLAPGMDGLVSRLTKAR